MSPDEVGRLLRELAGSTVFVVTHEAPDGDAIGSLLAVTSLLRGYGANPVPLCADPCPDHYTFLPGTGEIGREAPAGVSLHAVVFVDCATAARAGKLAQLLDGATISINIDHHTSNTRFASVNWVCQDASSTGEMIAGLYSHLGIPLCGVAEALYTAMVTDTGLFSFESTSPQTHRIAAKLLEAGVRPGEINDRIYNSRDPRGLLLLARALAGLKIDPTGQVAHMILSPADFAATGAGQQHTDGIVNYARSIAGVRVGLLFYSLEEGLVKIGIRTRPGVDASRLAAAFGGGGHVRAAGCRIKGELKHAVDSMLTAALEHLGKA